MRDTLLLRKKEQGTSCQRTESKTHTHATITELDSGYTTTVLGWGSAIYGRVRYCTVRRFRVATFAPAKQNAATRTV